MDRPSRVRGIYSLFLIGAAMTMTLLAIWLVWIVWRGGWALDRQEQQLHILGIGLFVVLGGVLAGMGFLAIGGPVGRIKAGSRFGDLEIGDDHEGRKAVDKTSETVETNGRRLGRDERRDEADG